ncbi:FAD-binding oxidoreductase [Actibacterium lipolyticum]|uniref:Putative decaprenylphosphoryl-beta-D-ribose oxidase n=1 Tax=Actibacterium lipolyticum TaxID=1524263 RepID=A0A238KNA7_9RHOB|nr:FAD-binding oxidoreductase [Actibacterium lipolyticum]SMX44161.1 putative decaprenylphosphoryl-beta-D-ribose oxidase [Actibacterium lipolyticum]
MKLSGWGQFPRIDCHVTAPRTDAEVAAALTKGHAIARGNGRAYGDSAASAQNTVDMRGFNRMIAFDDATGQVVAEAGVLLGDVINAFLPRGWFPPVTPGTKFVTIGGMIAADVHGKNHHKHGTFGAFVDWIDVMGADGTVQRCSPTENADLFAWTMGGMGLTGIILRAAFRLSKVESAWIKQTMIPAANLDAAMDVFEASGEATYSVAWIDCLSAGDALGRSLVMLGEHAPRDTLDLEKRRRPFDIAAKSKRSIPFNAPSFALNSLTVRAFNAAYFYNGQRKAGDSFVDWDSYFYPLDAILGWNRIYGRKGFMQFQCALPLDSSKKGLEALLRATSVAGQGSFLAVLKRFGAQDSRFSFPMEGYTLALDFPVNPETLALMKQLDQITLDHGGRFYLAKDARMTPETLRSADPRVDEFLNMRAAAGRAATFSSAQSERLKL